MQRLQFRKIDMNITGFSIHKRIEGGATEKPTMLPYLIITFQYPQADRRGCNGIGIERAKHALECFSIHKRIEGGATAVFCPVFCRFFALSIISGGSEAFFLISIIYTFIPFSQIVNGLKKGGVLRKSPARGNIVAKTAKFAHHTLGIFARRRRQLLPLHHLTHLVQGFFQLAAQGS